MVKNLLEFDKLEYLEYILRVQVCIITNSPPSTAVAYLWVPNGSLPQAVSLYGEQASRELCRWDAPLSL